MKKLVTMVLLGSLFIAASCEAEQAATSIGILREVGRKVTEKLTAGYNWLKKSGFAPLFFKKKTQKILDLATNIADTEQSITTPKAPREYFKPTVYPNLYYQPLTWKGPLVWQGFRFQQQAPLFARFAPPKQ